MVDYEALRRKVKVSGYKRKYLAKRMGLSDSSLRNKLDGRTQLKISEVEQLCRLLNIGTQERDRIFFWKVHVDFGIYTGGET